MSISLVDLSVTGDELDELTTAVRSVLARGWFVLGPEVRSFEQELAAASGRARAVGVSSGTDALILTLRAMGVGPADEVIVPAMTAFATAAAVLEVGATPVIVDIEPDRPLLDLDRSLTAVTPRTRAAIVVHLYGVCADATAFTTALAERGVDLIEDCAQAQGARLPDGQPVGSAGRAAAFSFYPTKNLGGVGDGGAVLTDDIDLADEVAAWRSHGERGQRYLHELPARNARLDDVQAAVLRIRLRRLADRIDHRRALSQRYEEHLANVGYVSHGPEGAPHLAVVTVDDPPELMAHLDRVGIASGRHYPIALHELPILKRLGASAPNAARWAARCVSLPLHDHLTLDDIDEVSAQVRAWNDAQ